MAPTLNEIAMYEVSRQAAVLAAAADAQTHTFPIQESQFALVQAAEHQRVLFERRQQIEDLHLERFKREESLMMAAYSSPVFRMLQELENSPVMRAMRDAERAMAPIRELEKQFASVRALDQLANLFPARESALARTATLIASEHMTALSRMTELMRPAHLEIVQWLERSTIVQFAFDHRMAHSHMALTRTADALLGAFGKTSVAALPSFVYSAPTIAPFISAEATSLILDYSDDIEAEEVKENVSLVLKGTKQDRERLLVACDPILPELLGAAREALVIGGPDYTARVCASLRRSVEFALDSVAPMATVLAWNDPRNRKRPDRNEPTRVSRVLYATRACDSGSALGKMLIAQLSSIDSIVAVLNAGLHAERDGIQPVALYLVIEQTEAFLHSLAFGHSLSS
jgi:hypothetical protein